MVSALRQILLHEDVNFLVTNRIPRRYATRFMAWFSRIENPLLADVSIRVWQAFAGDLRLDEAKERRFNSLHACFTRELKPGARAIDPDPSVLVSPCDAEVGAFGSIEDARLLQIKGLSYSLGDLVRDPEVVERHRNGLFATLRLKSSMYHRFHAPCDCRVTHVRHLAGDTWNVNPIALKRVERLFCRNERAVVELALPAAEAHLTLVPVAAILVAGIKLHCVDRVMGLDSGGDAVRCDAPFAKGQELGYFQSGSTIVVLASRHFRFCPNVVEGITLRQGQPLLWRSSP